MVGSSIVKRAFVHARGTPSGIHLGLSRIGIELWWEGYGGMHWFQIKSKVRQMLQMDNAPKMLIVHCGGNDIGFIPISDL